jgi:hypothetical protein
VLRYQCIKNPWYVAPTFICPKTLQNVPECKPAAADAAACSTKDCNRVSAEVLLLWSLVFPGVLLKVGV